jgi:hypothetical protein
MADFKTESALSKSSIREQRFERRSTGGIVVHRVGQQRHLPAHILDGVLGPACNIKTSANSGRKWLDQLSFSTEPLWQGCVRYPRFPFAVSMAAETCIPQVDCGSR